MKFAQTLDSIMSFMRDWGYYIFNGAMRKPQATTNDDEQDQYTVTSQVAGQNEQGLSSSWEMNLNFHPPNDSQHLTQETEVSQRSSRDTPQGYKVNGSGNEHNDDRTLKIAEPETELEILEKKSNRYREDRRRLRKERDEVRNELHRAHKEQNELQKKFDDSRRNLNKECQGLRNELQKKEEQQSELKQSYDAAIALIQSQKRDINELTVEISRSVNTNGTTTRGDDYFEAKFASLEGAIRQWVFRSSRDVPDIKHQDLLPTVQTSLEATVLAYKASTDSKASTREIQAAVAERLRAHVFQPIFVLTIQDQFYNTEHMSEVLGGTGKSLPLLYFLTGLNISITNTRLPDLERREWHARTVGMILRKDHYDDHFRHNIRCVERDLQSCFNSLLRGDGEEQRCKSLLAIIEQAAKLQVEVFRQVSSFRLHQIRPGERYDARLMDDLLSLVDEDEAGTQIFIVRVVVFPPVLRYGFNEDGKASHAVVVRKGTVVTVRSED